MSKKPLQDGLPKDFVDRIHEQFPDEVNEILNSFQKRVPVIRINTLLSSPEEILEALKKEGIDCEEYPILAHAFIIKNADRRKLTDSKIYQEGKIYIQSLASQLAVKALDPKPGEKILDLCAAPGSKTTQIAIAMKKKGELLANDNSRQRIYRLKANLEHQQVEDFVTVQNYSGQNYPTFYPDYFDAILVDAPCSSESRFDPRYPKSINFWSRHKVKSMAKIQKRLLVSAFDCLKPGGRLVYSTCTLSPEENEAVLENLIQKRPEAKLEPLDWDIKRLPILSSWKNKTFSPELQKAIRIYPNEMVEAFFIALIHKKQ